MIAGSQVWSAALRKLALFYPESTFRPWRHHRASLLGGDHRGEASGLGAEGAALERGQGKSQALLLGLEGNESHHGLSLPFRNCVTVLLLVLRWVKN